MAEFLWWIGMYNMAGVAVLAAMQSEAVADNVLRRATEVATIPYEHGAFGRMWLWWCVSTNAFMGAVMMLASRWDEDAQREVTIAALGVYALMWLVMAVGGRGAKFGRGIWVVHALWIGQMAWAGWSLMA